MHELLTCKQMGKADQLTIEAGTPGIELMERAGNAIAVQAEQLFPLNATILILCGPGNNGGDGFVAARLLQAQGLDVRLVLLGSLEQLQGDAALAAKSWSGPVVSFSTQELEGADGVIDALFGAGLTRTITGSAARIIKAVNQAKLPVLCVDLPSGIDGTSGQVRGTAIRATRTVSFFRRKPGHLLLPGREYCGTVEIADIGIQNSVLKTINPRFAANGPVIWRTRFPWPVSIDHKYKRGHAVIVSGGIESTGAARLAALSALRMGAGLVSVATPLEALAINAAHLTAVMVKSFTDEPSFTRLIEDPRKNVVVIGPGAGVTSGTRTKVLSLLESNKSLVIDADALGCFAQQPEHLFRSIKNRTAPTVLTPHDGEYQRLFPQQDKKSSRLEKALQGAQTSGAILVLKGPDTVIAQPDGRAVINDNAPAFLATAGSGDVLAGMIGGLLAQHMPVFEAACAAVWLHGDAASGLGPGLISEDLPGLLPAAIRRLGLQS